jgi:hypothetical protein
MSAPRKEVMHMHDDTTPDTGINLRVVYARTDDALRMVAGFTAAMPALADAWHQVERALADVPAMGAIITRLAAELAATRLDRANLIAAMRATLAAHADGEDDPLAYLRIELDAPQALSAARARRP